MFNFSVIVIKTLLKILSTSVLSFNFPPFTVMLHLFHWLYFPCLFLYNVPCCFYFVMRFCNTILKCCFLLLISFLRILKIFNKMCVCFCIIAVISEGLQIALVFAGNFYSLCDPIIIVFHTFVFKWKNSLENV
jgi:hypothetical protein